MNYSQQMLRQFFSVLLFGGCIFIFTTSEVQAADLEKDLRSGKKTINFSGKEGDDVKVPKNVTVIGESPAKAIINSDVTLSDGAVLRNITINARLIGVTVEKGASVMLDNVTIKGALDAGVFTKEGTGTLTVKNSRIIQNRKGFYILPGKNVNIVGNEISRNKEEGLDVRYDVTGVISGNKLISNGEGGAEIIAGEASLKITNNSFSQNKASGAAFQFYKEAKSMGSVSVTNNTFSGNGNYGVFCGSPSGGKVPQNFFKNSIRLLDNTFGGNKKGNIFSVCGFGNAVTPKEVIEPTKETVDAPLVVDLAPLKEAELKKVVEEISVYREEVKQPLSWQRKMKHWFLGSEYAYFASLEEKGRILDEKLGNIIAMQGEVINIALDDNVNEEIAKKREEVTEALSYIHKEKRTWRDAKIKLLL